MGSELSGVIYILDEPSIGLHQRDNEKLLATLKRMRDIGNTVVVVDTTKRRFNQLTTSLILAREQGFAVEQLFILVR